MTAKKKQAAPVDPYPIVIESFSPLSSFAVHRQDEPSAFNGCVRVHRYRITCERIDEPIEVIRARIAKLWRESDNHHEWDPILRAARAAGIELRREDCGADRKVDR